jgi:hypothetical protein
VSERADSECYFARNACDSCRPPAASVVIVNSGMSRCIGHIDNLERTANPHEYWIKAKTEKRDAREYES